MRALILNILPQAMTLIGIAGIIWMVAKKGFPLKQILRVEKVRAWIKIARTWIAEHGIKAVEKLLRQAKIYTMRVERFFSSLIEKLVARKNTEGKKEQERLSFWKSLRKPDRVADDKKSAQE